MRTYLAIAGGAAVALGLALLLGNLPTGAVAGLASCGGSSPVCPTLSYSLANYRLNGTVSGNFASPFQITSLEIESGPTLCVASTAQNCTSIPAVFNQTATSFSGAFSYAYPVKGNFVIDLQIGYKDGGPTVSNASTYTFYGPSYALVVPSMTSGSCGSSCATIYPSFAWKATGLVANFSDQSSTANGILLSTLNTTAGYGVSSWSFGDGSALGGNATPSHTYAKPGTYTVTEYLGAIGASGSGGTKISAQVSHSITVAKAGSPAISGQTSPALPHPSPVSPEAEFGIGLLVGGAALLVSQFFPWPGRGTFWSLLPAAAFGLVGYGVFVYAVGAMGL